MGYYTRFELTTKPNIELNEDELSEMSGGYGWEVFGKSARIDDSVKWYDFNEHMKKFSKLKKHKDVLFVLNGEGEESGDIWQGYYKNGKSIIHHAVLTFPEFKEEDLK